ncbi:nicotinate-nucleotide--dimethylbenzimidazole phosphoribosyltransferase [Notoacmeibacter sp. MSK16QG-6]|uniref:nicotinate-nucleotide--dimethylbenzimidazole phosphoribosyltransferase n=1 Tax=Notoacmeibacter sp. MSK16QG-6 TaxID=2957982 RepID=UPI0020A10C8C|nr:nicotinate-nucleotide--dimethylbenzimidazole phosphoribosyltransferase [Notoacmeibacter sp. MSK16QG-6]MCP1199797.1 nicotinate-nucleotide--dimethylbenzimidazole phosphoribosyltransferase [Notoacmeibacter sp. MSK16QG-6]
MFENLDDIAEAVRNLPEADKISASQAAERQAQLTKPAGSLGRLEELAIWLSGWQGNAKPRLDKVVTLVFAGNHGVAARGVSLFPADVTTQMVANFEHGGAAINQLCRVAGSELKVIALKLDEPATDFTQGPSLSEEQFLEAVNAGYNAVPQNADLICVGEMGIGNTTAAAGVAYGLFEGSAEDWAGRGTGVDDAGLQRKIDVLNEGYEANRDLLHSSLGALRAFGGRELAAMFGAALACRIKGIALVVDGYVSTAAVAPLFAMNPHGLDHAVFAHQSAEQAHRRLVARFGQTPLLDLGMRLGEASGAAVAILILRAAVETHNGMATFAEAGVSESGG